ncbi:hypothetical protein ACFYXQ_26560 [Nocardia jiangxiensis]|uniref:Uncharacterized protein n=1 Tax=Nocardia jiangxiensis TaxID=282685 RepID=A0ABW6S4Y6_9NOCA
MATEHPGMGRYNPDPGETGNTHPTEDSGPTERMNLPGQQGPGFAEPQPTHPLPGMPNPTLPMPGLGSEFPLASASGAGEPDATPTTPGLGIPDETKVGSRPADPDVGGAVHPPPDDPPHGRIERQEAGVTQPRPPTVAEARARDKARKRAEEAERAAAVALETKQRNRKRMLIGGAAIVGVAAVVGAGYLACQPSEPDVTAYCTTDTNGQQTVVDDNDCVAAQNYATSTGAYHSGLPAVFFFNGHQYRYYYGGANNTVGRPPVGGSFSAPSNAHVSTKSGTVIRGGLGSSSGGKSGGS